MSHWALMEFLMLHKILAIFPVAPWSTIRAIITIAEQGVLTGPITHYNTREN